MGRGREIEKAQGEDFMLERPHMSPDEALSRPGSPTFDEPPIDLVHLSRQCQGDQSLGEELLGLFRRLAGAEAARLSDPKFALKAEVAHKLRGSALAIGAGRVARAAEAVEFSRGRRARRRNSPPPSPSRSMRSGRRSPRRSRRSTAFRASSTVSQALAEVAPRGDGLAARASIERFCQGDRQLPAHRRDRVGHVAFGTDRGLVWIENGLWTKPSSRVWSGFANASGAVMSSAC